MIDHKAAKELAEDSFKNKNGDLLCYSYLDMHRLVKEYFDAKDNQLIALTLGNARDAHNHLLGIESALRAAIGEE